MKQTTSGISMPLVAVIGRPNVGKSTFFNRVIGGRVAIVADEPGVTRDRNFARADWAGREFYIVDTGGIIEGSDEPMDREVRKQAHAAIEEADVLVLLVDGQTGVHPLDERIADELRAVEKPIVLAVNKMDNHPNDPGYHDFWSLGLGDPVPVAAISGRGSGDLLDAIVRHLPPAPEAPDPDDVRVAVIGKPNVGKSSFVNRLFGEERVVVSDIAGTTRDAVDTPMRYHGQNLVFIDTAGLRRQSKRDDELEYYSALRTERVVREADVCLVVVDSSEGLAKQDLQVAEQAWENGAGVILVMNKWDLVEKSVETAPTYERLLRERAPFLQWVPILFTSALSGQRVRKTLDLILEVQEQRSRRIDTSEVNEVLQRLVGKQPPPHSRGRQVKIKYGTQVAVEPPFFALFANFPKEVPAHYIRYLHNGFRKEWSFFGSPIRLHLRPSSSKNAPR